MNEQGKVYWITGLSGAGKTTVGTLVYKKLRKIKPNVVILDGDDLREVFGNDLGYTEADRRKSARRNARICHMLATQGIDVVCCTISMFDEVREWNREHIARYCEIYLKASYDILVQRNPKGLYEKSEDELVGFGVEMEEPKQPDMVIENNGSSSPEEIAQRIWEAIVE